MGDSSKVQPAGFSCLQMARKRKKSKITQNSLTLEAEGMVNSLAATRENKQEEELSQSRAMSSLSSRGAGAACRTEGRGVGHRPPAALAVVLNIAQEEKISLCRKTQGTASLCTFTYWIRVLNSGHCGPPLYMGNARLDVLGSHSRKQLECILSATLSVRAKGAGGLKTGCEAVRSASGFLVCPSKCCERP